MFNGTKRVESIENAAQMSGQNVIHIDFSKLIGCSLLTTNMIKARSPNITWMELQKELSMQYSIIPSNNQATQASPN